MIYIEDMDSVLFYLKIRVTQERGGGTSWHNAGWNVGMIGLMNDFFFVDKLSGQAYGWILLDPRAGRSHEHRESILEPSTWPLTGAVRNHS
jgi:hypothetical protein